MRNAIGGIDNIHSFMNDFVRCLVSWYVLFVSFVIELNLGLIVCDAHPLQVLPALYECNTVLLRLEDDATNLWSGYCSN